jgi:hypothetical protein
MCFTPPKTYSPFDSFEGILVELLSPPKRGPTVDALDFQGELLTRVVPSPFCTHNICQERVSLRPG